MAFGTATVPTNRFKQMCANKVGSSSGGASSSGAPNLSNAPQWMAMGSGATSASRTAASGDTGLSVELYTRSSGAITLAQSSSGGPATDTVKSVATITATSSGSIDEATLNDTSSSGGSQADISATFAVVNLNINDSIQFTTLITFT